MKKVLLFIIIFCCWLSHGQDFSKIPSDYNITEESVNKVFTRAWTEEYSFQLKTSINTYFDGDTISEEVLYDYDATKKLGKRWKVISEYNIDFGPYRNEKFINVDHKDVVNNGRNEIPKAISLERIKFDSIGTDYIVFKFDADPNALPIDYEYVAALQGYILINKETRKFEKIRVVEKFPYEGIQGQVKKIDAEYFYYFDELNDNVYLVKETVYMELEYRDSPVYIINQSDIYYGHQFATLTKKQKNRNAKTAKKAKKTIK